MARVLNLEMVSLCGISAIKDVDSTYLNMSEQFALMLGWKNNQEAIGKADDQIPCAVREFSNIFRSNDKKVLTDQQIIISLDFQHYRCGWQLLLIEKKLLKNHKNEISGIIINGIDLSKTTLYHGYMMLRQLDEKISGQKPKAISYILDQSQKNLDLTSKQEACLFFIVRGKTTKDIAKILKISPRTVESHLDAIKNKLQCNCKAEIIEKIIESGFFYHIPQKLLNVNL